MTPELIEHLACGRGYYEDDDETPPAPPSTLVPMIVLVTCLVITGVQGVIAATWLYTARHATGTIVFGEGDTSLSVSVTTIRDAPILTGHDGVDRAWALVRELYPDEALFVADILIEDSLMHGAVGAGAYVQHCDTQPQVIHIDRSYLAGLRGAAIGQLLAHEMTHITQCRTGGSANREERQREAVLRESDYLVRRQRYYEALGIDAPTTGVLR